MSPSSSVMPIAQSRFFKTQIFRNNNGGRRTRIWNPPTKNDSSLSTPLLPRRVTRVTPPVIPPLLRLPHPSSQIRHRSFLSHPPLLHHRESPMSSLVDSNATNAKTVRVVVKGRVQGVFYRNWTMENAKELGLKGWVRNRRDGSVEALFSGSPDKVLEMEQRCRRGPPAAMVTGFEVSPCSDDPGTGFDRRPTV